MSKQDVYSIAEDAGIPAVHMAWPIGSAPSLPWFVFYVSNQSGFNADDTMYAPVYRWALELYQKTSDEELEAKVEQSILEKFGSFSKSESWVEDENCLMTTYYFTDMNQLRS